jgi:hypothetical protein
VLNAALRFTPPLSPGQMSELFKDIGKGREEDGSRNSGADGQTSARQGPYSEDRLSVLMTADTPLVWVIDENGNPRPIVIKTGVSDNSYIEVIWGKLKEGQQVITGLESGSGSSQEKNSTRGMMMMGPPPPPR